MHPSELSGDWTVTNVDLDCGHLTYDDVARDHTYVLGVECSQGTESITLLYYDQRPDGLDISVGDRLAITSRR